MRESLQTTRTIPSDGLRPALFDIGAIPEDSSCEVGTAAPGVTVTSAPGLGATELLTMDRDAFAATIPCVRTLVPLGGAESGGARRIQLVSIAQ